MVQFGKRAILILAAVALIGVAGTAAAATMVAPQQHTPTLEKQVVLGTQGEPVAQPVAPPQHHGGCHWGMGDQSTKYQ